ncbi:MAG: BlaI/MecI/CopY family transcriptional regulator [Bacteroidota bacterium]
MATISPTQAELMILRLLWAQGPATVRAIHEQLKEERDVGYTTTLKLMQIMHDKGLLSRVKSGKTHIYRAEVSEDDTQQDLVRRLMDTAFQGSAMKLVMKALGSKKSSQEELDKIRAFLNELSADEEPPNTKEA